MTVRNLLLAWLVWWTLPAVAFELSGKWSGDDGGSFYLRQLNDELYWYAEGGSDARRAMVFSGKVRGEMVLGTWADVPKGGGNGNGEIHLAVRENGNVLEVTRVTGGFPVGKLLRAGYKPPPPPVKHECLDFVPEKLSVRKHENRIRIMQDDWWLFDFGDKESDAYEALRIIRHYSMNQSCFVGKPEPSFRFLLAGTRAPLGAVYGEDCVPFRPTLVALAQRQGRWQIVDESVMLFDFGTKETEARAALALIKEYQFSAVCYVGRPAHTFEYLRR